MIKIYDNTDCILLSVTSVLLLQAFFFPTDTQGLTTVAKDNNFNRPMIFSGPVPCVS